MSLNLGTKGTDAAKALRPHPDWKNLREALYEVARQKMNQALEPGADLDARGYARALRDIVIAFEAATLSVPHAQVKRPGPAEKAV